MNRFAFWNNKGGVGKSFLAFTSACEYAIENEDEDVLVLDLCPQANLTEMLLGGNENAAKKLNDFYGEVPRRSVGGYFESRLTSPFIPLGDVENFICHPSETNSHLPANLYLLPGDNLLELLAEAIRQASQMALPTDAWPKVMRWLSDLVRSFSDVSAASDVAVFIDCNPSFSIYTQIALCSADSVIVPFTSDDSSRRGIENVFALLYGIASSELEGYAKLSFSKRAQEEGVALPKLHSFISNRVTMYKGKPSSAFQAKSAPIKSVVSGVYDKHKKHFAQVKSASGLFLEMPDYHSVAVVASSEGCPLSKLKSGHHDIDGDIVQVNQNAINKYRKAIAKLIERL